MLAIARSITILLVAIFLMMAGTGMLTTVLGIRLAVAQYPTLVIGLVMSGYFAGLTLGSLLAYKVILAVGHIRAFSAFASLFSAAALGHALGIDPLAWGALRLVEGFCMAGLFVCVESWLNQSATLANRGQVLSLYMFAVYGGQGAGQYLLNLDAEAGFVLFVVISILLSLALVPVALTRMVPPTLPDVASMDLRRLAAAAPVGLTGTVASGLAAGALYSLAPVFVQRLGFGTRETALFMSAAILGGIVLQWPLGWLSDLFDRRTVIVSSFLILVLVSLGLAASSEAALWILLLGAGLFGGVTFALYPLGIAHANDRLDPGEMVAASGGLVLSYSVGATIGPFAASALMNATGPVGLFLFTAMVGAVALVVGLWRMRVRAAVPAAEQGPFRALPRTTPVAGVLDDRADVAPD